MCVIKLSKGITQLHSRYKMEPLQTNLLLGLSTEMTIIIHIYNNYY